MASPAERYAASRRRAGEERSQLTRFRRDLGFDLDPFQVQACEALEAGRGVLVAAPTGAGKTVVGEFAVHLALAAGRKAFYTTPIKALSNQKHAELSARFGPERVGLLTGDTAVNGDAPVVVMTTEVLRNMLYADSPALVGLGHVVMDEVHYLADRFRGAVWEEVIIHLPDDVLITSLSATVSNAEEFGAWLATVRGQTEVVVSEHRPVPLWQHVMVGTRLMDLFTDDSGLAVEADAGTAPELVSGLKVNPELVRLAREDVHRDKWAARGSTGRRPVRGAKRPPGRSGSSGPSRAQVLERLDDAGLLPVITFVFSRAGCDAAVRQCVAWGLRLTTESERLEIRALVEDRCADIPDADLQVLGYWEWVDGLSRGVAAHHAGLLPTFKEVVEELFSRGLVKAVFATETLALGINMPARSVVLEKLVKFNGESHVDITPGEYTQLTGRAGRRGIDVEGHAVVLWSPGLDAEAVAGLASTRTYPLRSSFRPTYNMAVNLVAQVGRSRAREVLETSFAQFQADRGVVGLARQARKQEEALAGYAEAMRCHLGDFSEYAAIRRRIGELEKDANRSAARRRRSDAVASLEALRVGDVIRVPAGRRAGFAVVLDPGLAAGLEGPRPTVLTADKQVRRITVSDVPTAVEPVARVRVPSSFDPRNPASRRDLASSLRTSLAEGALGQGPPERRRGRAAAVRAATGDAGTGGGADGGAGPRVDELTALRRSLRQHPCHGCPERDDHARWAERWSRLEKETRGLLARIEGRTGSIARTFDRVCDLLVELGYLAPADPQHRPGEAADPRPLARGGELEVTAAGERLRRVYAEKDLLVAQCLDEGTWDDLDAAGLAAVLSSVVYEARREEGPPHARMPGGPEVGAALQRTVAVWSQLTDGEEAHQLPPTGEPDLGLVWPVHRWARGQELQDVLDAGPEGLAAGDFVRWCRQLLDLLDQVVGVASASGDERLARTARRAAGLVDRGVVAYSVGSRGAA
ncbi:RNA helicase [Quadrisphaera sp. DSM 44207]|uniref:DEAD/DEAH box helicase n=1 Tax=Quadrisphaera sp. DSM 44207 TaxID=1881057 RepID=UPI000B85A1E3|nr:DEAD/DEAH box helicase [Quadrisphaera sp. DSM 44207]